MLARVLVALAASVAAEKVKIGDIQTFHHAVRVPSLDRGLVKRINLFCHHVVRTEDMVNMVT